MRSVAQFSLILALTMGSLAKADVSQDMKALINDEMNQIATIEADWTKKHDATISQLESILNKLTVKYLSFAQIEDAQKREEIFQHNFTREREMNEKLGIAKQLIDEKKITDLKGLRALIEEVRFRKREFGHFELEQQSQNVFDHMLKVIDSLNAAGEDPFVTSNNENASAKASSLDLNAEKPAIVKDGANYSVKKSPTRLTEPHREIISWAEKVGSDSQVCSPESLRAINERMNKILNLNEFDEKALDAMERELEKLSMETGDEQEQARAKLAKQRTRLSDQRVAVERDRQTVKSCLESKGPLDARAAKLGSSSSPGSFEEIHNDYSKINQKFEEVSRRYLSKP